MNIKEIENFVTATLTVVAEDVDEIFPIDSDEINEIVFGEIETDDEGNPIDDELSFTEDEGEANKIFQKIVSLLTSESLEMYSDVEYDEDVDEEMLIDTIESIKKSLKKEKNKTKEDSRKKESTKKDKTTALINIEDLVDFNNDLKDKVDKSYIIIDEDILKNPEKDVKEYFGYLFENLLTEDIEHLSSKSQDLLSEIDGFDVEIVDSKEKDKKEKIPEDVDVKEKKKRGRKAAQKEDIPTNNNDDKKEKPADKIENETNKEDTHSCCGKCSSGSCVSETVETVLHEGQMVKGQQISIEFQAIKPAIDKSFVVFLEDIISAIKKYQGE